MGERRSQRLGPSPTLRVLGPSHQWRHKSRVSLRGPLVPMVLRALLMERCATVIEQLGVGVGVPAVPHIDLPPSQLESL